MEPAVDGPARFDRYEILGRLGAGGMGEVFKARALGPHGFEKVVALKRVLPDSAVPELADRFIAEARVAARLHHANIVQVYDFGRAGDELFLVMEYVQGLNLGQLIRALAEQGRELELSEALYVGAQVGQALDYAHRFTDPHGAARGVVHRDVSPANILVSRAGEVKLGDFGVAVAMGKKKATLIAGKRGYMPPEQAAGLEVDGRADLYSLGVVLGKLKGRGTVLDALVERLTRETTAERYPTAQAFLEHLLQLSYDARAVLDPLKLRALMEELSPATAAHDAATVVGAPEVLLPRRVAGQTVFQRTPGVPVADGDARATAAHVRKKNARPSPALLAVAGGALVLVGGVAALALTKLGARRVEPVVVRAPPPPPPPALEAPPRVEAPPADAPPAPVVQVAHPVKAPPKKVEPPTPTPTPAPAPPATATSTVDFSTDRWAEIWVDGVKQAVTAPRVGVVLPVGHHHLKLVNPQLQLSAERDIDVVEHRTTKVVVDLAP